MAGLSQDSAEFETAVTVAQALGIGGELLTNWKLARGGKPLNPIAPLE